MRTVVSKSWDFRTYRIQAKSKCIECGKSISKTFSFEYREDTEPCWVDIEKLKKEKQEWEQESHTCTSCLKKRIKQERKDMTHAYDFTLNTLIEKQEQICSYIADKKRHIDFLNEELKNKVIVDKDGTEWVIYSVRDGWQNGAAIEITCDKVNKVKPWLCSDEVIYFYVGSIDGCYDNYKPLCRCTITDEDFSQRAKLLKGEN